MSQFSLLSLLIVLPLIGVVIIALVDGKKLASNKSIYTIGGICSIAELAVGASIYYHFNFSVEGLQFVELHQWLPLFGFGFDLAIDAISLYFILLTAVLIPICLLASVATIQHRVREFVICFLLLESLVMGVFASTDLMLFYFFFEASIIPMYFIIGIWGGEQRKYAAFKFFLYTLAGSLLMLAAIIYIYSVHGTTNYQVLVATLPHLSLETQKVLWLGFFIAFAIKVPMWPVHTWLPDAHVQAPTAGSIILAGILLKLGGYAMLRLLLPFFPDASVYFSFYVIFLSIIAIIYTSLVAFAQHDMKKLIAYSSIAHMGYVTMGIFTLNQTAIHGAVFQMISHGVVSAALFLIVGMLYDRMNTKEISKYGGVAHKMPIMAFIFMVFTMASIGLPGTSGFVGEFLALNGMYIADPIAGAVAALGMVLGAVYMLNLYKRVMFGTVHNPEVSSLKDLNHREIMTLMPLLIMVVAFGVFPSLLTDGLKSPIVHIIQTVIKQ